MARPKMNVRSAVLLVLLLFAAVLKAIYWLAQPSQDTEAAARRSNEPTEEDTGDEATQQGAGLGEATEDYLRSADNVLIGGV